MIEMPQHQRRKRIRRRASRPLVAALVACLIGASVALATAESTIEASLPPPVEVFDPTPRILGPISIIGDSVLRGALVSPPHLLDRLAEQGWGPIPALRVPGRHRGRAQPGAAHRTAATHHAVGRRRPDSSLHLAPVPAGAVQGGDAGTLAGGRDGQLHPESVIDPGSGCVARDGDPWIATCSIKVLHCKT